MNLRTYLNLWRTARQDPCGYSHIIAPNVEHALALADNLPGQDCATIYSIENGGLPLRQAEHAIVDDKLPYHGIDIALPEPAPGYAWWGVLQEDRTTYDERAVTIKRFAFCQAARYRDVDALADDHWPLSNATHGPALVYDLAAMQHHLKHWHAPIERFDHTFPSRTGHRTHIDDEDGE